MKKFISLLISAVMIAGIFSSLPLTSFAAKEKVSLKKNSATVFVYVEKGKKNVYTSADIKVNKAKGVKIEKITYKNSAKKIVKVSKKGTVTAKKKGSAKITVKVKYKLKKKSYTKTLTFKVTVKRKNVKTSSTYSTEPYTTQAPETTAPETTAIIETTEEASAAEPTEPVTEASETYLEESEPIITTESETTESKADITEPTEAETQSGQVETESASSEPESTETEETTVEETVVSEPATEEPTQAPTSETTPDSTDPKIEDTFNGRLAAFSNKLYTMSAEDKNDNFTMSPISVYMALSILYYTGDSDVKSDIETLTGMNAEDFSKTGDLFKSLENEYKGFDEEVVGALKLTNSIWADENQTINEGNLNSVLQQICATFHKTTFNSDNAAANEAVRKFVKKNTNGLIDKDFKLDPGTIVALINTLYLKDIWSYEQEMNTQDRDFYLSDGNKKNVEFLLSDYRSGQAMETDTCYYFHTNTANGYKLDFILPKEGCTVKQAMSKENLDIVKATNDYKYITGIGTDVETEHYTSCVFPCFEIRSDVDLTKTFSEKGYLKNAFEGYISPITESELFVTGINHSAILKVNKEGIEGAAVTLIANAGCAAPERIQEYHQFILDREFGFIISDYSGVTLFEGQVTNPETEA